MYQVQYPECIKNWSVVLDTKSICTVNYVEKVEQFLSLQVSRGPASEDEYFWVYEDPDPSATTADAPKYLYTVRKIKILENRGVEQELYSQYYSLAKNIEHSIIPIK